MKGACSIYPSTFSVSSIPPNLGVLPLTPRWHSGIALTGVKGGHSRLGPLAAHSCRVWPGHSPPASWAQPAQGSSCWPGQAKDGQGCVSRAQPGRGGGARRLRGGGKKEWPAGGAPRLGCPGGGVAGLPHGVGLGPGFPFWAPPRPSKHLPPGRVLAGEGA